MSTQICTDPVERLFYAIGQADSLVKLRNMAECISEATSDPDECAELLQQILARIGELDEIGNVRWN